MTFPSIKDIFRKSYFYTAIITSLFVISAYATNKYQSYSYKETGVPAHIELSPRLQNLFSKTKTICFGRYVLDVPEETQLTFGSFDMEVSIRVFPKQASELKKVVDANRAKLLSKNPSAEVLYDAVGPTNASWQIRSVSSQHAKKLKLEDLMTFVVAGEHVFLLSDAIGDDEDTIDPALKRATFIAQNLRARDNADVPKEPGVCIDHGFISENSGKFQEIFSAGIYMPSIPDVNFSVMSNKNASTKGANGEGLISRHEAAMKEQGIAFPASSDLTRLRIGKHVVNDWNGEEVLLRHNGKDGAFAHEFMWAFVGKTGDLTKPASVDIQLDSGVGANTKLAKKSSITNDEAVALWDKLLSSLRFRT